MENKIKFEQEYLLKTSVNVLFSRLSTASGLAEWFADNVNIKDDNYTFDWEGSEEIAHLVEKVKDERIRFQWETDENTDYYFEFQIKLDGVTKQLALIITDFAEVEEVEEAKMLWDKLIDNLHKVLGA